MSFCLRVVFLSTYGHPTNPNSHHFQIFEKKVMMRRLVIYVYDIRRLPSCTVYLLFKQVFSQNPIGPVSANVSSLRWSALARRAAREAGEMPAARANIDWTIGCRNFFCIEGIANAHIQYILLSHHERNSLCICSLLGRASSSARMFGMRRTVPHTPAGDGIP